MYALNSCRRVTHISMLTKLVSSFVSEREHRAPKLRRAKLPQPRTSYEHMIKLVLISFYVDLTRKDV